MIALANTSLHHLATAVLPTISVLQLQLFAANTCESWTARAMAPGKWRKYVRKGVPRKDSVLLSLAQIGAPKVWSPFWMRYHAAFLDPLIEVWCPLKSNLWNLGPLGYCDLADLHIQCGPWPALYYVGVFLRDWQRQQSLSQERGTSSWKFWDTRFPIYELHVQWWICVSHLQEIL